MKKILHVTFNMGIGGTESVIRELVNGCTQVEHEILCIDGHIGETGQTLKEDGIPVHILNRKPGVDMKLIFDIAKLAKSRNIDILHCHQYTPFFYGGFSGLLSRKKYMLTEHGRHHPDRKRSKAWVINKILFYFSIANVAISKSTLSALKNFEFLNYELKSHIIYNGISSIRQSIECEKISGKFACIARFDKNKNQESIVKTIKYLHDTGSDISVDFYGDGENIDNVKTLATKLNISDLCDFKGFTENPSQYLSKYSGLILASYTEGTSMVILESFREGTPVIATNVGGTPELITNEETGFLFEPDNTKDLADILMQFCNDNSMVRKISQNSKMKFNRSFTATAMCNNYMRVYSK